MRLVLTLAVLLATIDCAGASSARVESGSTIEGQILPRDREYEEAWLRADWKKVAALVAPDYWGVGDDFSWDFAKLQEEFPKVKALEYKDEAPQVKQLSPGLVLLNRITRMRETYAGADISGRYWISEIWVHRSGRWLLLVEQEVLIQAIPPGGH